MTDDTTVDPEQDHNTDPNIGAITYECVQGNHADCLAPPECDCNCHHPASAGAGE